jgi:hypothetical protein
MLAPIFSNRWPGMYKKLLILCGVALLCMCGLWIAPRSDEWFIKKFQRHKHDFEDLATLLEAYQMDFVSRRSGGLGEIRRGGQFTEVSRHAGYATNLHRLFSTIGCEYASRGQDEIIVCLPRNGFEHFFPGGYKVFAFRASPPVSLVESVDEHRRKHRGQYDFYQSLGEGWYLKYQEEH